MAAMSMTTNAMAADITPAIQSETHATPTPAAEPATEPVTEPATEPETPAPPETEAPQPETPAETDPPQTEAPETEAPETETPETEAPETEAPQPESPAETEPSETDSPESETPSQETEKPESTPAPDAGSETESETESKKPVKTPTPAEEADTDQGDYAQHAEEYANRSQYNSNSELLAHQKITEPVIRDFRFTHVNGTLVILKKDTSIHEEKNKNSIAVGKTDNQCVAYILEDEGNWYYIESGEVRGFIEKNDIMLFEKAAEVVYDRNKDVIGTADALVKPSENKALTHTLTTTQDVVVDKLYAVSESGANVYENPADNSRVIGTLPKNGISYILADADQDYIYVESDSVRGFVEKSKLIIGEQAEMLVDEKGEAAFGFAEEKIAPEDTASRYYTITSTQKANGVSAKRKAMIEFAKQFVGNPYVWGGTSLTNGADCSGFCQTIYSYFGYSIPRVAEDQAIYGQQIPIASARPGDLIFYARGGYVYHVSMYIGNGQVVQAYSSSRGIIISEIGPNAVWATNVLG